MLKLEKNFFNFVELLRANGEQIHVAQAILSSNSANNWTLKNAEGKHMMEQVLWPPKKYSPK